MPVADAAIATSSLMSRAWRTASGRSVHHLLDPSSGRPVRSGLISATALAPTALHAETLAKVALMLGARRGRDLLAPYGGVLVDEDGRVDKIGEAA
jgi:thiamine biosynthesis lipoprotein